LENIAIVTYTNSNCRDVWPVYFGQLDKYASSLKSYVFSDIAFENFNNHEFIVYKNKDPYYEQYIKSLKSVKEDYIIYCQEDFIMYDHVDYNAIKKYIEFIKESDYSFVRLIRSGFTEIDHGLKHIVDDIYDANTLDSSSFSFQMQATIWKKSDMIKLYKLAKSPLWLEPAAPWRECIRELQIQGAYCYNGEEQKGKYHWDTRVFPHIVSAIQKGQWNTLQYNGLILEILKEYNIDPSIRGERKIF